MKYLPSRQTVWWYYQSSHLPIWGWKRNIFTSSINILVSMHQFTIPHFSISKILGGGTGGGGGRNIHCYFVSDYEYEYSYHDYSILKLL
jgi:hypothetical protein